MVKFKLLAQFPVDHLSHPVSCPCSCISSYSLFALIHCIMWMIVSSLSPHYLRLLFCWVLSILLSFEFCIRVCFFLVVFLWCLSDSKALQISRTPLSILADLQQCCSLDDLDFLSDYQFLQSLFPAQQLVLFIFTNPSARAGYDTRSIFKRSLTGFISEYSFS